jgi:hypothetical protein
VSRRRNKKRRKGRKERAEQRASEPRSSPKRGATIPPVARFFGQFRGGPEAPTLDLTFKGPLVRWEDPEDPSDGLKEKVEVQRALEDSTPDSVN